MKKQPSLTTMTSLCWRVFFLLTLFLAFQVVPPALGQRDANKPAASVNLAAAGRQGGPPASLVGASRATQPSSTILESTNDAPKFTAASPRGIPPYTPGSWTQGTPYPTTIVRYGFAQTATDFYVFGGVDNGSQVNAVNRMDIATGAWESRAPMPFTSEAPSCALMESTGIVYCAQGDTGNAFSAYNIATDTWTSLASIPGDPHYGSASGAFNGKVFVAGGTGNITNLVQVYDVASNTWSTGTAAPSVFLLAGYQQVGPFLYVVGGFDPTFVNNATTWRLDMSSAPGVWEVGPAFTPKRADFGLAYDAATNKLYALGGDLPNDGNPFNSTNLVDELSVVAWPGGSWDPSPPDLLLPNRQANQAGFYGAGDIWSVGGLDGATFQFLAEVQHRTNGSGITLGAHIRRQGGNRFVVLDWSPADGGQVNVLRNGSIIGTTDDDGNVQKNIHAHTGTDTYQVCETDTGACSNVVTVTTR